MTNNINFQNWKIEDGDYKRDHKSTNTYLKKVERKRLIKKMITYILILMAVIIIAAIIIL